MSAISFLYGPFFFCLQGQIMEFQSRIFSFVLKCVPAAVKNKKALFRRYF